MILPAVRLADVTSLILVAAGSGERLGAGVPKALVTVAGDSLIGHCLTVARQVPEITHIVVVAPEGQREVLSSALGGVEVVAGGATRDESVRAGLAALPTGTQFVLVHDAARPFTPPEVFRRVHEALLDGAVAVIPAVAVVDTIKRVHHGQVVETVDRSELVAVQTPQGFRVPDLQAAHEAQRQAVTDDAMLLEQLGVPVVVVEGSNDSFKITTPFDLAVARAMKEPS